MFTKTKAIVLGVTKFSDSARMVNTYTEQFGKVAFAVKISHNKKRALTSAYFMPLTMLDIEMDYHTNQEVQYIKECKIAKPYCQIPFDAVKNSLSYFIAEVLQKTLHTSETNCPLYSFVENSLCFLDATNESCANFHLIFLLNLSKYLGFAPNTEHLDEAHYFDMQAGVYVSSPPLHDDVMPYEECLLLHKLCRLSYWEMHLLKMSGADRRRMLRHILRYYQIHQPNMGDIKSIDVLETIFK